MDVSSFNALDGVAMHDLSTQPVSDTQASPEAAALLPLQPDATWTQPKLFSTDELHDTLPSNPPAAAETFAEPAPRINRPERFQGEFRAESLDQRLEDDHHAQVIWAFVES